MAALRQAGDLIGPDDRAAIGLEIENVVEREQALETMLAALGEYIRTYNT